MGIFDIPTPETLYQRCLAKYKEIRTDAATSPGSDADLYSTTTAHLVHGLHIHLLYGVLHNLIPTKASGWALSAWAWFFGLSNGSGGFGRILERGSVADEGFTFVGDGVGPYDDLFEAVFLDSAGQRFQITEHYTPGGAGATTALDVIAITKGKSTNIEVVAGETYTWESQPIGVTSAITQVLDLDSGADEEKDSELRARLASHLQSPPMGGNWAHWKEVAEEASPGNVDAFVYEGYYDAAYGFGATDITCLQRNEWGTNKAIDSADALYDLIDDALNAELPLGSLLQYRLLDTAPQEAVIEGTITLNNTATDAQKCDWDAEDLKAQIAAADLGTKTITATADVTGHISTGDRVIIGSAQAIVTNVGITGGLSADTKFQVEVWFTEYDEELNPYPWQSGYLPTSAPAAYIISGGGTIMDILLSLRTLVDSELGVYKGDNASPQPGWDDTLRKQAIQSKAIVAGDGAVIDMTVAQPATDTQVSGSTGTTIRYFIVYDIAIWEVKP